LTSGPTQVNLYCDQQIKSKEYNGRHTGPSKPKRIPSVPYSLSQSTNAL